MNMQPDPGRTPQAFRGGEPAQMVAGELPGEIELAKQCVAHAAIIRLEPAKLQKRAV
jgi:hypothetical protein